MVARWVTDAGKDICMDVNYAMGSEQTLAATVDACWLVKATSALSYQNLDPRASYAADAKPTNCMREGCTRCVHVVATGTYESRRSCTSGRLHLLSVLPRRSRRCVRPTWQL